MVIVQHINSLSISFQGKPTEEEIKALEGDVAKQVNKYISFISINRKSQLASIFIYAECSDVYFS
jgi:hypothetical protein